MSVAVALVYVANAVALCRYPWDWSPDEGLLLDAARRLLEDPSSLYGHEVVPYPNGYGPVLPLLLAPVVALSENPLLPARVLALAWTALIALGVYRLVRSKGSALLAWICAALALAPLDLSFWYMLIRADAPMTALWLWSAVWLLPERLAYGVDRLSWPRLAKGASLLLLATLTKPLAVLYGAPLVLGWLLVDLSSALRLAAALGVAGFGVVALMNALTAGGFLWVMSLAGSHKFVGNQLVFFAGLVLRRSAAVVAFLAAGGILALRRDGGAWRDGALLLWLGGLAVLPLLNKGAASWNYLLPWLCATVVLAGRLWGAVAEPAGPQEHGSPLPKRRLLGLAAASVLAGWLLVTHRFPLPGPRDRLTAEAFYGFIRSVAGDGRRPILATNPDYAYYLLGQPVEIEGSAFGYLVAAGVAGTEKILARLESASYAAVVVIPQAWPDDAAFRTALQLRYRPIGVCRLGYYYGNSLSFVLFVPRGEEARFEPPERADCSSYEAVSAR